MSNAETPDRICIVADDLTGAADAAVAFRGHGLSTEVRLDLSVENFTHHVTALNTATRDVHRAAAIRTIQNLAPFVDPFPHLFKKVDSVYRGNTFLEIAASVHAFRHRLSIIAPAAPNHGRLNLDGQLQIPGLANQPLRQPLEAAGLTPLWLAATTHIEHLAQSMCSADAVFCEATQSDHLRAIVRAARSLNRPILWIGSSGLAHALAESLHPGHIAEDVNHPQIPSGPVMIFTGSDHDLTLAQLGHLRAAHSAPPVFRIDRNQTPDAEILGALRSAPTAPAGCIFLNGGDTALHVCRALSIRSLHLRTTHEDGVPLATAIGGPLEGTAVILKSGGFGSIKVFTNFIQRYQTELQPA